MDVAGRNNASTAVLFLVERNAVNIDPFLVERNVLHDELCLLKRNACTLYGVQQLRLLCSVFTREEY